MVQTGSALKPGKPELCPVSYSRAMDTRDFEQLLPNTEGFTLFYGHKSGPTRFFSNFFPSEFTEPKLYEGLEELDKWRDEEGAVRFHHVEQYMHAIKAIIFADFTRLDKIMEEGVDPARAKKLGRMVENYVEEEWQSRARGVVARFKRNNTRQ